MSEYIKESVPDKGIIIEMIDSIKDRQYLEMIYGFVSVFHEMEEKTVNQTERDYKALIADEIQGIADERFLHRVYISVRDYPKDSVIICGENINMPTEEQGEEY